MITLATGGTIQGSTTSATTVTYTIMGIEIAGATDAGAGTPKVLAQGQMATTTGALYTVPGSTSALVKGIHLKNTGSSVQVISLFVNGTAGANALPGFSIPANGSALYDGQWTVRDSLGYPQVTALSELQKGNLYIAGPRPWCDVVEYGADPLGVTDSLAAFNLALAVANAAPHGVVYVPSGDYRFSAGFSIPAFVRLLGAGMYECRLVQQFTTGDFITMGGASTIEGFWIVGAYVTTTAGGTLSATPQTIAMTSTAFIGDFPISGTGTIQAAAGTWIAITWTGKTSNSLTGCTGSGAFNAGAIVDVRSAGAGINTGVNTLVTIRDLYIQNQYVAIDTGGVSNWIEDIWIRDTISVGILCDIDDGTSYIRNLWLDSIYSQPAAGVRVTQGSIIMSDSNIMRARIGLDFPIAAGGIFSPFVINCFLDNCADAGMSITGPGTPNVFDRGKFCQCWFSSSTNGVVLNNTGIRGVDFVDSDFYLNSANGLQLLAAQEVGIEFCRFANNTTAGINAPVTGGPPDLAVKNCLVGPVGSSLTGNGQGIITSGTLNSLAITNNNLAGNTGAALNEGSTVANPGQKIITDNAGLSVPPAPMVTTPATFAAVETVITAGGQLYLPANSLLVGTTIKVTCFGIISATTPTLLARLRIGTAGTTADTQACATAAAAVATTTGWFVEGLFTVRTIGSGGTCLGNILLEGTAPIKTAQTATVAVNTTVANFLSFTLIGGGTTPVVTVVQAFMEIVKQ